MDEVWQLLTRASVPAPALNFGLLAAIAYGLFKLIIPRVSEWREQASRERGADFARLRAEIADAKKDATDAKTAADKAESAVSKLENMLACMRPAISILTAEVRRLDPNADTNAALMQVQELLTMAATGDFGFAKGMIGLAAIKGTKE